MWVGHISSRASKHVYRRLGTLIHVVHVSYFPRYTRVGIEEESIEDAFVTAFPFVCVVFRDCVAMFSVCSNTDLL